MTVLMGLKKKHTSIGRDGVNYIREVVERNNCIFHEIDQRNDFGNDAFIELVEEENVRGICIALQIKSGKSFCSKHTCKIPASRSHFRYWSEHSLRIVGVVYDPNERTAYWTNISRFLKSNPSRINNGPFTITFSKSCVRRFDDYGFKTFFLPLFLNRSISLDYNTSSEFAVSDSNEMHAIGIRSLFYGHRNNSKTWELLISIFENRAPEEIDPYLVYFIAHIPNHPDLFWSLDGNVDKNSISHLRERISGFSHTEVLKLLTFVDDRGFERGAIGQSVEAIISIVRNNVQILKEITTSPKIKIEVRKSALMVFAYYQQKKSIEHLKQLVDDDAEIRDFANYLLSSFERQGFIDFY